METYNGRKEEGRVDAPVRPPKTSGLKTHFQIGPKSSSWKARRHTDPKVWNPGRSGCGREEVEDELVGVLEELGWIPDGVDMVRASMETKIAVLRRTEEGWRLTSLRDLCPYSARFKFEKGQWEPVE